MKLTPKIQKAINVAAIKHFKQNRKGSNIPYIVHPFSVAWILSQYTDDEDIIVAGLMHDVLEDVKNYSFDDLNKDFGERVAKIVKEVSEDKDPNVEEDAEETWDHRKNKYLEELKNESNDAMMITAADKIHNLFSLIQSHKEQGEDMWQHFNAPREKKLWFYGEVIKILIERLDNEILNELVQAYNLFLKQIDSNRRKFIPLPLRIKRKKLRKKCIFSIKP